MQSWKDYFEAKRIGDYDNAKIILSVLKKENETLGEEFFVTEEIQLLNEAADPEIVKKIDIAILKHPTSHRLLELKSDIVYERALKQKCAVDVIHGINIAIEFLEMSERHFNEMKFRTLSASSLKPNQDWYVTIYDKQNQYLDKKTRMRLSSDSLSTRKGLIDMIDLLKQQVDSYENDKIKQFEQLALFSAILALIITNVQVVTKLSIEKIFVFNISLAITLIFVLTSGSLLLNIGQSNTFYKRWNFWFSVSFALFGYIFYLNVK